jgi:hypothetical protein
MKAILFLATLILISCQEKSQPEPPSQSDTLTAEYVAKKESPVKEVYTKDQIEYLKKMGMSGSWTVKENHELIDKALAEKYEKKFIGCRFISNEFLQKFMEEHNLVMGELSTYMGDIPAKNIDDLQLNLNHAKSVDSSLQDYYFIRQSRLDGGNGSFLQRITENEIPSYNLDKISGAPGGSGQPKQKLYNEVLTPEQYGVYRKKYNVKNIIVDHNIGAVLRIIAPKELFNLDGKQVVDRMIIEIKKDPAIMFQVNGGWMSLTAWK